MRELEIKCEDLKVHIETTQSAKQKMESIVQGLQHSLSPMRIIPTEILNRIFEILVHSEVESCRSHLSKGLPVTPILVPLILSQVCRRWREVTARDSSLWNFLYFDAGGENHHTAVERFRYYEAFGSPNWQSLVIPRCDAAALWLLCKTTGVQKVPYKSLELIMLEDPVSEWQDRWNTKIITSQNITIYRSEDVQTIEFTVSLLQAAQTVTVYGTPPPWYDAPWTSLDTLILKNFCDVVPNQPVSYGFTRENFIHLLNSTPFLRRLELDFRGDEGTMALIDRVTASSTSIKYLAVHPHHFIGGKGLFGVQLTLPALDTLEILSFSSSSPIPVEEEFIFKHFTPRRVILSEMNDTDITLAGQLLRQLPNVGSLEMNGEHCNSLLRLAHADYHNFSPLLMPLPIPQVTTLRITDADIQGDVLIRFVEMKLQHRKAGTLGVVCLEEILIYTTPGGTPADWGRVKAMLDAGRRQNDGG